MSKKYFSFLAITSFLLFFLTITLFALRGRTSFSSLARQLISDPQVSLDNSYVFASPLSANSSNNEKIRVTVFILNSKGLGVTGKQVELKSDLGLTVEPVQSITDSYGKSIFDISAVSPGEYLVEARVNDLTLNQSAKVIFQ